MFWEHGDWLDIDASEIGRVLAVLRESMQEHEAAAFVEDATTAPAPGQVRFARARARRMAFYADQWMYELSATLSADEVKRFESARAYLLVGPARTIDRDPRGGMPHRRPAVLRHEVALSALPMHGIGDAGPGIEGFGEIAELDLRKPGAAEGFDHALVVDYLDFHLAFFEGGSGLLRGGTFRHPDGVRFRRPETSSLREDVSAIAGAPALSWPGQVPEGGIPEVRIVGERVDDGMAAIDVDAVVLHRGRFDRCLLEVRENPVLLSASVAVPERIAMGVAPPGMLTFEVGRLGDCGIRMLLTRYPRRLVDAAEFLGMLAHAAGQPADSPLATVGELAVVGDVDLRQAGANGPLRVRDVEFMGAVSMEGFRSEYGVEFVACGFARGMRAANGRLEGDFVLRESRFHSGRAAENGADAPACLDLYGMRIGGDADFRGISVGGAMDVSHVHVRNLVCLGADIAGDVHGSNLVCGSDAVFQFAKARSIELQLASLKRLQLGGACVRGDVNVQNGRVEIAVCCDSQRVEGELRPCEIGGTVKLSGAQVGLALFNGTQGGSGGQGVVMLGGSLREFVIWNDRELPRARFGFVLLEGVTGLEKLRLEGAEIFRRHVSLRRIDCTGAVKIDSRGMDLLDLANSDIRQLEVSDPVPRLNLSGIRVGEWRLGKGAGEGDESAEAGTAVPADDEVEDAIKILGCMAPLDRSVWVALETDLRNQGRVAEAGRVFRAMKKEERAPDRHLLSPPRRALSWLSWLLYGHGTRVWPGMLLWALLSLLLVLVLQVPDNVKLSEGAMLQLGSQCNRAGAGAAALPKCAALDGLATRVGEPVPELTARRLDRAGAPSGYGEHDALMLGLHYAVPFIGFDGTEWTPVDGAPSMLAAIILGVNTLLLSFAAAFVTRRWLR